MWIRGFAFRHNPVLTTSVQYRQCQANVIFLFYEVWREPVFATLPVEGNLHLFCVAVSLHKSI